MIKLMKYTYMLEPEKIEKELNNLWNKYNGIIDNSNAKWEELNEARAILFLIGNIYCEKIAIDAIERRLHLMNKKLTLIKFLDLIDKESKEIEELRKDLLFLKLEKFYRIVKKFKNKYEKGKYYLNEEEFIKRYNLSNPDKNISIGYKGEFKNP